MAERIENNKKGMLGLLSKRISLVQLSSKQLAIELQRGKGMGSNRYF